MNKERFSVDAALVQELGQRLIGRPAIALGELIKNSFDADASTCRIEFGDDQIIISDDGHGMSEDDFHKYWMRIGTTHKVDQAISRKFGRPLTGSKGIGRLSTQFLAEEMTLESTPQAKPNKSLYALVDWTSIVRGKDLDTVTVEWELRPDIVPYPNSNRSGTRITLKGLKDTWDADVIRELGADVWMLRPPFKQSKAAKRTREPEDFDIEIEAPGIADARAVFDETLETVLSNWKARVRCTVRKGRSGSRAVVYAEFKAGYPDDSKRGRLFRETIRLPLKIHDGHSKPLVDQVTFEIYIFRPEGRQPGGISVHELREYLAKFGNVSVYDAGFRLPYYGSGRDAAGQDWLSIAVDQGRRVAASDLLPEHLQTPNRYLLDLPAPGRIFGAVEIDTNHERTVAQQSPTSPGPWLQIQPGRDRVHDNPAFSQLRDLVRFSLDFYANRYKLLSLEVTERLREGEPPSQKYERALEVLDRNKEEMPAAVFREVRKEVMDARKASATEEEAIDRRAALLAPLASAGMAALALNHEITRESRFLDRASSRLRRIGKEHGIPELEELSQEFAEVKRRLESLQDLFAPLLSEMDKAVTDRLKVRAVVEQVVDAMKTLMPGVKFETSDIPAELRFPLGSLAEWNALLQNALSNAWNAMLDTRAPRIRFTGGKEGNGREWLRIGDNGAGLGVDLAEAPRLFEPFERRLEISRDKQSIAIGGQGLGLAIVRMIARRRSAKVAFVQSEQGFSTTFEMSWTGARK